MGAQAVQSGEEQPAASDLSRDDLHHVLRNRRRRFALHHLKQKDRPVEVGDLATQLAAWENGVDLEAVTSTQRRRVYNALQQTHIPELDDTGLIDVERNVVELTPRAKDLEIYTEIISGHDFPWSQYYLALSTVAAALMTAVWVNVFPFGLVEPIVWAGTVIAVFLGSSIVHTVENRRMRLGESEAPPELDED